MATIGCLGEIPFEVSSGVVRTLNNMQWSGSARYATHQRHLGDALTEFVGLTPDKFSFEITLSSHLGVDPMADIGKLWDYKRRGTAVALVVGDKAYGKYRWNVLSHKIKIKSTDAHGNVTSATVSVELQEYLRS